MLWTFRQCWDPPSAWGHLELDRMHFALCDDRGPHGSPEVEYCGLILECPSQAHVFKCLVPSSYCCFVGGRHRAFGTCDLAGRGGLLGAGLEN